MKVEERCGYRKGRSGVAGKQVREKNDVKQKVQRWRGKKRHQSKSDWMFPFKLWTSCQDYKKTDGGEESCFLTFQFKYNQAKEQNGTHRAGILRSFNEDH